MRKRHAVRGVGVGLVAAALGLGLWWWHFKPQPPAPGPDTGWHMAIDKYGDTYWLGLRYDKMTDDQKDDANRFTRANPNGGYDPTGGSQ